MTDNGSPTDANAASESAEEFPAKLRVHALARALGLTSRKVLEHLAELGHAARSPQSSIDRDIANTVRDRVVGEQQPAPETADVSAPAELPGTTAAVQEALPIADDAQAPEPAAAPEPVAEPEPVAAPEPAVDPTPTLFSAAQEQRHEPLFAAPTTPEPATFSVSPLFLPPEPQQYVPVKPRPEVVEPEAAQPAVEPEADEDAETGDDAKNLDDDSTDNNRNRRRRRGRRGRGRGRGEQAADGDNESDSDAEDTDTSDESSEAAATAEDADTAQDAEDGASDDADDTDTDSDDAEDNEPTSKRRRRRRRRKGGGEDAEDTASPDDPPNTVVHEREPRSKRARDEVQGISGSTRLEAKRQRRRDGRDAGRRRPPILSESEFLARREAVDRVMVVRERGPLGAEQQGAVEDYTQVAVLEDGVLVEHFVTTETSSSMVGNIYLGRVQNVLPGMEAAFVDIGRGRNGVLYAGEVNWDAAGLDGGSRKIEQALKPGDSVLVQVSKDPVGHKGARLTTQISLAGRYLVYVPGGSSTGISRKLPDTERKRLRSILGKLVPEDAGVIIRTASEGVSAEELGADIERLESQWKTISSAVSDAEGKKGVGPKALYEEPDLLVRVVRDLFNEDFRKLVVEGPKAWNLVERYISDVAPDLMERVEQFQKTSPDGPDSFVVHRIDEQLAKALDRKVWLPSGGTLIIEHTEAMTVVDVNTGKFTGSGGNLEETVTRNNLEAAEEIVRQMRLRDIGGMIIVDFIDMVLESNRDLVLRRLTEALARDRTRHQVSEVTSLGLVQMTRKRLGTGLLEAFSTTCTSCGGRGVIVHANPVEVRPTDDAAARGGDSGASKRSRRKGRKGDAAQDADVAKPAIVAGHHPAGEHPMFRAMAAHAHDHDIEHVDPAAANDDHDIEMISHTEITAVASDGVVVETVIDEVAGASAPTGRVTVESAAAEQAAESQHAPAAEEPAAEKPVVEKPVNEPAVDASPAEPVAVESAPVVEAQPVVEAEPVETPAPRRRRRAARRPASSTGTSTTIVISDDDPVEAPGARVTTSGPIAGAPAPVVAPQRRPRRRAAGRPAGPPVGD
ncbi:Rne/Rng family ribonuclease [Gordonia sp. TBRC 11910]|uniref:Ribonuclease E n=1 Tax=Gordonia asplenii TaxID=2725283 RepID=A0A848KU44_9ACTN|nr:translation initiation factor IF-2 N-terminal domain-containing protein [Gordonia asplenii]NMN99690.1 Rne/Rng family ribonuclease [Gordonia asplenii]